MNIIEAKNLSYSYDGETKALDNLSVSFEKGCVTAVLGGNGAGKSTLFLSLDGIIKPDGGEVLINGEPIIYKKKELNELKRKIGIVFQDPDDQLFSASVYEDISFGAVNMGLAPEEVTRRVDAAMELVGITHLKDKPTHALSFGQKKRAAVAGIIVMEPEVIILDEPTAGLDPSGVSSLMHLLEKIRTERGCTIIMSTHEIDIVPIYADRLYVMDKGRIIAGGTPEEVFSNPDLLRENNLRLPRISHLLEILKKRDGFDVDFSAGTISAAREEIKNAVYHNGREKI